MSELAPLPHPLLRRLQRIEVIREREQQIAILAAQQRLEVAALFTDDRAGISEREVRDELALAWRRSPRQAQNRLLDALGFAMFPAVHARIADGTWLLDHADAVTDELCFSGLDQAAQEQVLELVLSRNVAKTPWELRTAVRTAIVEAFIASRGCELPVRLAVRSRAHEVTVGLWTQAGGRCWCSSRVSKSSAFTPRSVGHRQPVQPGGIKSSSAWLSKWGYRLLFFGVAGDRTAVTVPSSAGAEHVPTRVGTTSRYWA